MKRPAALLCILASLAGLAGSSQDRRFEQAIETYRQGDLAAALAQVRQISLVEQSEGLLRVVVASRRESGRVDAAPLEAALALTTEDAFASERVVACGGMAVMSVARGILVANDVIGLLQKDPSEDAFVRAWFLSVMSHDQGQAALQTAQDCFNAAPERIRAHPEMLLSLGALHEFGWWREHEDDAALPGFKPDLGRAERAYREAAAADPALQEARLRLGRVLGLRDRADESLATLSPVIERGDPGFAYLARLFQGEIHERREALDKATASYAAAVALMPFAQSAKVALAQLAHRQGRRSDAATRTRDLASATRASDSADPWFWYYKGTAWRTESYVLAFRAIVQRPR